MSVSTDAMYNAESRYIHKMFKIHFSSSEVLEVTRDSYLVSSSVLEESYKLSDSPFGEVTSNEISITLFNDDGLFNPKNTSSKYYGLIKKGIKIEAFIRPDEVDEWDPFGVYYVTDWYASGLQAEVTANDALYNVLNGSVPSFPVFRRISFAAFAKRYFAYFGYDVKVDSSIDTILPYVYTSEHSNNKIFLSDLLKSVLADCFCDHYGDIKIISKVAKRAVRAKLTDDDQIISITVKQSITTNYDSATVTYNKCQESSEKTLIDITDLPLSPGMNSTGKLTMSEHPVLSIRSLKTTGPEVSKVTTFNASAIDFVGTIQSTTDTSTQFNVVGTKLDLVEITVGEDGDAPLNIKSNFIQEEARANIVKEYTEDYLNANMPILELTVRGNPKYQLGDILEVESSYYKTQYTGILIKASYEYIGSLSCNITLADASNLKEV